MGKPKKKRKSNPPLSLLDQFVYWGLFLLLICLVFGLMLLFFRFRRELLLKDPRVVAEKAHVSGLWAAPFFLVLIIMGMAWWNAGYSKRRPIFGKKGVRYGPPEHPDIYPILMRQEPRPQTNDRQRKKRRTGAILCLAVLCISLFLLPLSFYGRDCLYADGTIVEYNMFNVQRTRYESWQLSALEISACDLRSSTVGHSYGVRVTVKTTGGVCYSFTCTDFRRATEQGVSLWLRDMLTLRARVPIDRIRVEGTELLSQVVVDRDLNEAEATLLSQLFAG